MDKDKRNTDQWHIDKRVSISHLITTIAAVAVIFAWGSKIETRIALLEKGNTTLEKHMIKVVDKLDILVTDLGYLRGKAEGADKHGKHIN